MTRRELRKLVADLQRRMGLSQWRIEIDFEEAPNDGADASAWRSDFYDTAAIRFDPAWPTWSTARLHHLVAHELGHLLTRDLEEAIFTARDALGVDGWLQFHDRYQHEIEGVVDRYATIISNGRQA